MTNENGFGLKKDNAEADGQNTSASKKRKLIKKVRDKTCLYYQESYSTSVESWVSCSDCHRWAHCSCAGLEE